MSRPTQFQLQSEPDDDPAGTPLPLKVTPVQMMGSVAAQGALRAGGLFCAILAATALYRGMPVLAVMAAAVQGLVYVNCSAMTLRLPALANAANVVAIALGIAVAVYLVVT